MTTFHTVTNPVPAKQIMLDVVYLGTIPAKAEAGVNRSLKWLTQYTGLNFKVRDWFRQKAPLKTWPNPPWIYFDTKGIDYAGLGIREAAPFTLCIWKENRARSQNGAGHVSPFYTVMPTVALQDSGNYFGYPYYDLWASAFDYLVCHETLHGLTFWYEILTGIRLEDSFPLDSGTPPDNLLAFCANIKNSPAIRATLEKLTAPHGYGA